jgi:molybdenum cofactor cytidylyltransferase
LNTACAILAAGASCRLGSPKQLAKLANGTTLVRHAAEVARAARISDLAVVLGAHASTIAPALAGLELELLASEDPAEGVAASIRAAASWAVERGAAALMLCVCDQPLLSTAHLDALLSTLEKARCLTASYYCGAPGVPAVFPSGYLPELAQLSGDGGAAKILRSAPRVALIPWRGGEQDVDTPADLARLLAAG